MPKRSRILIPLLLLAVAAHAAPGPHSFDAEFDWLGAFAFAVLWILVNVITRFVQSLNDRFSPRVNLFFMVTNTLVITWTLVVMANPKLYEHRDRGDDPWTKLTHIVDLILLVMAVWAGLRYAWQRKQQS